MIRIEGVLGAQSSRIMLDCLGKIDYPPEGQPVVVARRSRWEISVCWSTGLYEMKGAVAMDYRSSCVVWVLLFGGLHFFSCYAHGQVYVSKTGDNTLGTSWATALFALSNDVTHPRMQELI